MKHLLIISSILLVMVAFLVALVIWTPTRPAAPMVEWIDSEYQPSSVCPGDVMMEVVTVNVRAPALIIVASTFLRSGPTGDTVLPQPLGAVPVVIIPTARTLVDSDPVWIVPDLPPGDYIRAIAAGTLFRDTEPVFRQQFFSIRDDCP